jgi:nitroimidazol reductase NimA-like FMN-containing flavoprotein (pyridoxamine 5'-phosphate oxidase superfamily)
LACAAIRLDRHREILRCSFRHRTPFDEQPVSVKSDELDFLQNRFPLETRCYALLERASYSSKEVSMVDLVSQRLPEKMSADRAQLDELFASTVLAHVGLVVEGSAVVFPTGFAVVGDDIVIHGSTGSRWMRALAGQEVSVTVTKVDGVIVARTAMLFGIFEAVPADAKAAVLEAMSDRIIPGRSGEVRPSIRKELAATTVLALPIERWSLRVSDGWPEDEPEDMAGDAWAGRVRFGSPDATLEPSPDLRQGIPVPSSVEALLAQPGRVA